jgi:hypothetical protein
VSGARIQALLQRTSGAGGRGSRPKDHQGAVSSTGEGSAISGLFDDRERGQIFMRWLFSIHFKQPTMVRSVRVEDVTDKNPCS